jgi:hypothetical protein
MRAEKVQVGSVPLMFQFRRVCAMKLSRRSSLSLVMRPLPLKDE